MGPADTRLERRLKRRCIANQSFKINKITSQNAPTKVIVLDEDYKVYLNTLGNARCNPSVGEDDLDPQYKMFCENLRENDLDPQYKMFWENLREDGTSYVLEVAVDKDVHMILKFEEDDRWGDKGKPGSPDNLRPVTKRENMENPEISKDVTARKRKTLIDKNLSKKASSRGLSSSEPKCKRETEPLDTGIDESYKTFLECVKEDGNCLVFVNQQGKRVKYEADEESESDSEILAADGDLCIGEGKETPFITSKILDSSCIENCNRTGHSQFRDNLMVILKKPYDRLEYEELFQEIHQRKPLERHRDLRGRIKSYSLEICSKSYLDHHTDLKRKIDAVQGDHCKILNLLRGFFYWLKNLSHEGAFQPWSDASCLKVMPRL